MSTVVSRLFHSTPRRSAHDTWTAIVDLLTRRRAGSNRNELLAISGIASSIIADQAPRDAAIVVTCDGPRTRIRCLYDDDAIDDSDAKEDPPGFDPLSGEWAISLPCLTDDLSWVRASLKKHGPRITARDAKTGVAHNGSGATKTQTLILDPKGFFGS